MAVTLKEMAVALVDTLPPAKVKKAIEYLEYLKGDYYLDKLITKHYDMMYETN